jgi:hypothetical protein
MHKSHDFEELMSQLLIEAPVSSRQMLALWSTVYYLVFYGEV